MCHDATALTGRRNPVRDAARLQTAPRRLSARAALLAVEPREILMVACHNFDLDAARGVGYRTAFVRRPDEWGPARSRTQPRDRYCGRRVCGTRRPLRRLKTFAPSPGPSQVILKPASQGIRGGSLPHLTYRDFDLVILY